MKRTLLRMAAATAAVFTGHVALANDVFISEYIEGSGNNKAVELYNPTTSQIDLSQYQISFYFNGNSNPGTQITLSGLLESGQTYIIADEDANEAITSIAQRLVGSSFFNGDDAIVISKSGLVVDSFGQVGVDPGSSWSNNGVSTQNASLVRKANVTSGDTSSADAFDPSVEFIAFANDTFDNLGSHEVDDEPSQPVPVEPQPEPGEGELIAPCFNCPDLSPVADPTTFDSESFYADVQAAIDEGQSQSNIKALLSQAAANGQVNLSYSQVWSALTATDEDANNDENVILFYSGRSQGKFTNGSGVQSNDPDNWNREHSWPKSHGFPETSLEAYTDIHHLRPTDISINGTRSNLDYAVSDNPVPEAPNNRVDSDSFEPRDEVKGDVARMMFYMDTRYEGSQSDDTPDLVLVNSITSSGTPQLGLLCELITWHNQDPVSDTEIARHDKIYQYQGNRNPFVDNPAWVEIVYPQNSCDQQPVEPEPVDPVEPEPVEPPASDASLMLTMVVDGTLSGGSPKAIELIALKDIADLSQCGIGSANNGGGTDGQEFTFPADAVSRGDYIHVANQAAGFETYFGFTPNYVTGAVNVNGDDAIEVFCNDVVIDVYGVQTVDGSGEAWEYLDSFATRNAGTSANGTFNIEAWDVRPVNTLDNVETGADIPIRVFELPSTNALFFSEYIEGSSLNKALEIVNLTGAEIDLSDYSVGIYVNGNDTPKVISLTGILAAQDVFVLANESSAADILAVADQRSSDVSFNGDDAVSLIAPDGGLLDVIGQIGVDPGSRWGSGDISTQNRTIRRKSDVVVGDTDGSDAFDPAAQWDGFAQDTFDDLGRYDFGDGGDEPVEVVEIGACFDDATFISEIQGDADASALVGQEVVIEGVITLTNASLGGFFLQEEFNDEDGNPATSEAVFVEAATEGLMKNDVVRVKGTVAEVFGRTVVQSNELSPICGTGGVIPISLELPLADSVDLEAFENMLVENAQDWTVSNIENYARFGEVIVSSGIRYTPTQVAIPGSPEAQEVDARNDADQLILDDLTNGSYSQIPSTFGGPFSSDNPLRIGTTIDSANQFVVDFGFSRYRLRPAQLISFQNDERPIAPMLEGNVKIASFNVLNLFNGDGMGGGFPTSRGADTFAEYERQLLKTVKAIAGLDADVVGLVEIENDGFGQQSAIAQLTDALNSFLGSDVYAFVNADEPQSTSQITVGILYKPAVTNPLGELKVLSADNSIVDEQGEPLFSTLNRPAFVQRFEHRDSQQTFVVSVNHFKSKGGSCGAGDDSENGQGSCNLTRTRAAEALAAFMAQSYDEQPMFIIGDLNAYAKEDPIAELEASGYVNVVAELKGDEAFSYRFRGLFGTLDYVMANALATDVIVDVAEWNINSSEAVVFDYNETLPRSSNVKPLEYIDDTAYRSSDHDPVVVSLNLEAPAIAGDLNEDGVVNVRDYFIIVRAMNTRAGSPRFNPVADLNGDARVDRADSAIWIGYYLDYRRNSRSMRVR